MRLFITGASGDLGRPLSQLAADRHTVCATYLERAHVGGGFPVQLDLRNRDDVRRAVSAWNPAVIIHAAISDRSPGMDTAALTAAQNLSDAAAAVGCRIIFLSTDMIFDGSGGPYHEDSRPAPRSDYGRVKLACEQHLLSNLPACLVVRTSLIYDFHPSNRQVGWMLDRLASGGRIPLFVDEVRHPIWSWNLAEALLELCHLPVTGILHVAGPEPLSRFKYGCALLWALGYDPAQVVEPVYAADRAPDRPRDLRQDLSRAQTLLATPLLSLPAALARAKAQQRMTG